MDQMKGMGVAPHLNPAFLQEMAAQGNPGAKGVQNMVSIDTKLLFDFSENICDASYNSPTLVVYSTPKLVTENRCFHFFE